MKKCVYLSLVFLIVGCTHKDGNQNQLKEKNKEELKIDTKILKSLNDSLNTTGDHKYLNKYIHKIDEMIKKYPNQTELVKVKENMIEIFGDSIK